MMAFSVRTTAMTAASTYPPSAIVTSAARSRIIDERAAELMQQDGQVARRWDLLELVQPGSPEPGDYFSLIEAERS
ncbi:hypothetical protein WMF23_51030 [Sorangium sp. So ce542]